MIRVPCMIFFVFYLVVGHMWLTCGSNSVGGLTKIYEVVFWRVLMIRVPCTSFFLCLFSEVVGIATKFMLREGQVIFIPLA